MSQNYSYLDLNRVIYGLESNAYRFANQGELEYMKFVAIEIDALKKSNLTLQRQLNDITMLLSSIAFKQKENLRESL